MTSLAHANYKIKVLPHVKTTQEFITVCGSIEVRWLLTYLLRVSTPLALKVGTHFLAAVPVSKANICL